MTQNGRIKMSFLSKSDLVSIKLKTLDVVIPEYGTVRIREMTGKQRDSFEFDAARGQKRDNDFRKMRAKIVVASVVEEDGSLMFTEDDVDTVNEKIPARVLDLLFTSILAFNGMSQQAADELEKNLQTGQNETSG
jgi:hypothetical protein